MREIEFRAYSKRTKKMYNVLDIFFYQKVVKLSETCGSGISFLEQLDDVVLMQYTGLKDNNGVYIYEGDVLRDSESIVIVKFVDGEFSVDYMNMGGEWRKYGSLFKYLKDYEGEVIGNVYKNPELLER